MPGPMFFGCVGFYHNHTFSFLVQLSWDLCSSCLLCSWRYHSLVTWVPRQESTATERLGSVLPLSHLLYSPASIVFHCRLWKSSMCTLSLWNTRSLQCPDNHFTCSLKHLYLSACMKSVHCWFAYSGLKKTTTTTKLIVLDCFCVFIVFIPSFLCAIRVAT